MQGIWRSEEDVDIEIVENVSQGQIQPPEGCRFSTGWWIRESYCPPSSAVCHATIPTFTII
jgi:hypothetical protein